MRAELQGKGSLWIFKQSQEKGSGLGGSGLGVRVTFLPLVARPKEVMKDEGTETQRGRIVAIANL